MRSAHFGQNGGWDESRGAQVFMCRKPRDLSATLQRPIFTKFKSRNVFQCSIAESGKTFSKIFTLGVICPQNLKSKIGQNRHLTQSRLQVMGCTAERYCLLHVYSPRPGSFRDRSSFLHDVRLRSYRASKLPNFRILSYFPHTKPLKRTFW